MIKYILHGPNRLLFRQLSAALCFALSTVLYDGAQPARADIVVDSFSDAIPTPPDSYRSIGVSGVVPNPVSSMGAPPVETGLSGVIGGSRMTTLTRTSGIGGTSVLIGANPGQLNFESGPGVGANVQLLYNNNGSGLGANLGSFLGISIPLLKLDLGTSTQFQVDATLNDGTNSATGSATTNTAQELIIPASAFAGVDLSNIQSILLKFSGNGSAVEFDLGAIRILTPEPMAILGWSVVVLVGLAGWKVLGTRHLRAR